MRRPQFSLKTMLWVMFGVAFVAAALTGRLIGELCILAVPILLFLALRYAGTRTDHR